VSLQYETNADSNPFRVIASIVPPEAGAIVDASRLMPMPTASVPRTRFVDRASSTPKANPDHKLYFSQNDEEFFITEDASTSKAIPPPAEAAFSMRAGPSIYVPNGTVQEWKIENRAPEAHAFHMHQIRFRVLKRYPSPDGSADLFDEFTLRDTVDLPAYSGTGTPPFVTVRIYFTEPDIRGNFMYHCHILEHEDKGMMGIVRVVDPSAMPLALLGKTGRASRVLAGSGAAGRGMSKGAGMVQLAQSAPAEKQTAVQPSAIRQALAIRSNEIGALSAPAQWVGTPTAAPLDMPVMRDRDGRVIEPQICTTPARKARRMLVAVGTS
jgi:Multicopper oxidase